MTTPHKWYRFAGRCYAKNPGEDQDEVRKQDAILMRCGSTLYDGKPLRRDVLALCEFTVQTNAIRAKREQLLCDVADVFAQQPIRGYLPALLIHGKEVGGSAEAKQLNPQTYDAEFYVLDRERLRRAIIPDCFGVNLSILMTVLGCFTIADGEDIGFIPGFRFADMAGSGSSGSSDENDVSFLGSTRLV